MENLQGRHRKITKLSRVLKRVEEWAVPLQFEESPTSINFWIKERETFYISITYNQQKSFFELMVFDKGSDEEDCSQRTIHGAFQDEEEGLDIVKMYIHVLVKLNEGLTYMGK